MRPLEALMSTIETAIVFQRNRTRREPGAIVARMSPEHREALQRLTSDDVQRLRMDLFWDDRHEQRQAASAELMKIDRTFRLR